MIKAIIFDCYGVVVGKGIWQVYEEAGGDLIKDAAFLDSMLDKANLGQISSEVFTAALADRLGLPLAEWRRIVDTSELPNLTLLDFIRDQLKPTYKVALLSNASSGSIQRRLSPDQLGLFDAVVISGDVGLIKPDPEIFKLTATKLGVTCEETVFTDDHEPYTKGATVVGMKTIIYKSTNDFIRQLNKILRAHSK